MATGTINLLGQNASVTIFIDKIFSRNDFSSATIIIPYMIDVGGFGGIMYRGVSKAEILLVKGELRTKESNLKIGEGLSIVSYNLTSTGLRIMVTAHHHYSFVNLLLCRGANEL